MEGTDWVNNFYCPLPVDVCHVSVSLQEPASNAISGKFQDRCKAMEYILET